MSERDAQLIGEFNARRSEDAFAALVRHHVQLLKNFLFHPMLLRTLLGNV